MEVQQNFQLLLTRFGNAHLILLFYGTYFDAYALITVVNKKTRQGWHHNHHAYKHAFSKYKRDLTFKRSFDEEISTYLLEYQKYQQYNLSLKVIDEGDYRYLCNFIEAIEENDVLHINKIDMKDAGFDDVPLTISHLYNLLEAKGVSGTCIQIEVGSDYKISKVGNQGIKWGSELDCEVNLHKLESVGQLKLMDIRK